MPSLLDRLQARLELFRLEQRYTRRRNRRSTFVSNATYVDGEYIYNTPASTGSSGYTSSSSRNNSNTATNTFATGIGNNKMTEREMAAQAEMQAERELRAQQAIEEEEERRAAEKKSARKLNRWSSMPGFGSMGRNTATSGGLGRVDEQDFWRTRRNSAEDAR